MEDCAAQAGISTTFLGDIERGTKEPSLGTLVKLSGALGVRLGELVAELEEPRTRISGYDLITKLKSVPRASYSLEEAAHICSLVAKEEGVSLADA